MTKVYGNLFVEYFCGDPKRCRLTAPLRAYSDVLGREIEVPVGFINDLESVPIVKGTNNESGVLHDYFSRQDSIPVTDKTTTARVYLEFQKYFDLMEGGFFNTIRDFLYRWLKTSAVWVAPRYFHRYRVMASYEELTGKPEPKSVP